MVRRPVVFDFQMSSFFGWGVYGLNLALHWANDRDLEPHCAWPINPAHLAIDPLRGRALGRSLQGSMALQNHMQSMGSAGGRIDAPVLAALNDNFDRSPGAHGVVLEGKPSLGIVFFETTQKDAAALDRLRGYPLIVCGSSWNERILRAHGLSNLTTVLQGVDPTLFQPAGRHGLMGDRFTVFSGGKAEFRKGQDLVIAAFARFARSRPDALLVTAWHSPWPQVGRSFQGSGLFLPTPINAAGQSDFSAWAVANGIPASQFLDLGSTPNALLPQVLREMDVALFPNRAEGGTNLVAMEAMACGVPVILSANSGHLDLIEDDNCFILQRQGAIAGPGSGVGDVAGWGESDVDEIVEALERAYVDRDEARRRGERGARKLAGLTWARTADEMKRIVLNA